jgi:paraquat-inducible protein B
MEQGPLLTLTFESADGLSAGQTQVKYKAVALGTVESIDLSSDNSHVIVRIRMNNVGARFLTDRARFWVERASFSLSDPSSLGSFVSGAYIAVDPGPLGGRYCDEFTGFEQPPGVRSDDPGRTYLLTVDQIGSLRTGSPVLFRDTVVGEVLGYDLGNGLDPVKVTIFVRAPFDNLVRPESHFWNASGISLDVQPGAFHVEFESLQALISGAVSFSLPPQAAGSLPSPSDTTFPLYASESQADSAGYEKLIQAVTYFDSSVAGLALGSPVDIYGVQVGVVTSVNLILNPATGDEKVRVGMELQPERNAHETDFANELGTSELLQKLVNHGMRAELEMGNYLTGQEFIALAMVQGGAPVKLMREGDAFLLPSQAGNLESTVDALSDISAKLDKIPFSQIGMNLNKLLQTADHTLGSSQTKQVIASLGETLETTNTTVAMLNQSYGGDSDFQVNLEQLMKQGSAALSSIVKLSDYLDRHPNALIFGRLAGQ